jgi:hypothetical protein
LGARLVSAFAIDTRSLVLFRVGLAITVAWNACSRLPDARVFFSDEGPWPRASVPSNLGNLWHLWPSFWFGSTLGARAVLVLTAIVAIALALGYRTRVATVVAWALVVSCTVRTELVQNGGNLLLCVLLFWSMFLDLGRHGSLDALRARRAGAPALAHGPRFSTAGAALLVQIALVYWSTAVLKWHPVWHTEGSALFFVLNSTKVTTPVARFMVGFPGLLRVLTFGTLALEIFGPFAALAPFGGGRLRAVAVVSFVALHAGIWACMNVGIFPLVSIVAWTIFIPTFVWQWLESGRGRLIGLPAPNAPTPPAEVQYDLPGGWRGAAGRRQAAPLVFLAIIVYWNATTTLGIARWRPITNALAVIHMRQRWAMFVWPKDRNDWEVVTARSRDGETYDFFTERPFAWQDSTAFYGSYAGFFWREYLKHVVKTPRSRRPLAAYVCRTWDAGHPTAPLASVELVSARQRLANPYTGETGATSPTVGRLWRRPCSASMDDAVERPADGDEETEENDL